MKSTVLITGIVVTLAAAAPSARQVDAAALAREGFALLEQSQLAEARKRFEGAAAAARDQANRQVEADAWRGLGTVLYQLGRWNDAPAHLDRARVAYVELGDRLGEARTLEIIGSTGAMTGRPDAIEAYRRAESIFAGAGLRTDQARVIRNMSHIPAVPIARKFEMLAQALTLAEGDARLQGLILHSWGSLLQTRAQYGAALERLERARDLLQAAGTKREVARLMGTLGGSYHMHGQSARAIEVYHEALELLEEIGDEAAQSQTTTYMAEAYAAVGQPRRSLEFRERSLEHAQRTGSRGMVANATAILGQAYVASGDFARAVKLMEAALGTDSNPDVTTGFYRHLARAYSGLGRHEDAVRTATRGIELARKNGRTQVEMGSLQVRSMAYERAGNVPEALADAQSGLDALERLRLNLAPNDYLKSGFANDFQALFAQTISLLDKSGRTAEAVAVAEQARARAFLDLLASRETEADSVAEPGGSPAPPASPGAAALAGLTLRGGTAAGKTTLEMSSATSAPVPTVATLRDAAARLKSTLLTYWVGDEATFVWVLNTNGEAASHRIPITRGRMQKLVRATWSLSPTMAAQRGIDESVEPAEPAEPADPALRLVTMRGGEPLSPTGHEDAAYRELYDLLIRPVRAAMPTATGSLITIIPHGPLFELSFAALADARGRFLLEDFQLHYAPSAATLEFTARRTHRAAPSSRYLFVANPTTAPGLAVQPLASLPGAEREVRAVSRLFSARSTTTLTGRQATESAVRGSIGDYRVVHFATHGLVSSANPLDSFLALASGAGDRATDGRLTAAEIYGLHLTADLVVLSACRAAGGRISGDGILGLTRAFFTAGTPSILAALWDMADESAEHLLPRFYAEWQKGGDKSRALRTAQLAMLRDLRAGRIKVASPFGALPLPPHPSLWANLVLIGEPR